VTVACISDTHGQHRRLKVPDADILIHAGDFTRFGSEEDLKDFNDWLGTLPHAHKIVVNGNHEYNASWKKSAGELLSNATFLRNEACQVAGVKIFGKDFFWKMKTPNPYDDLIPPDTDILVCHQPAYGYVDGGWGCKSTLDLAKRLHPRLLVCGHLHVSQGVQQGEGGCATTLFVNAASVRGDHGAKKEDGVEYSLGDSPILVSI
jgi:predicted phosphodiesterase